MGNGIQRRASLTYQHLARLRQGIQVRIVAVTLIGELLHRRVLEIAGADAQDRQEDAALSLALDQTNQLVLAGHADVEVAVGGQDDTVDSPSNVLLARRLIRQRDACRAIGRTARTQPRDGVVDHLLAVAGRR